MLLSCFNNSDAFIDDEDGLSLEGVDGVFAKFCGGRNKIVDTLIPTGDGQTFMTHIFFLVCVPLSVLRFFFAETLGFFVE